MPTPVTADSIAAEVQAAHDRSPEEGARVLGSYFADKVEMLASVPEEPSGILDGEIMRTSRQTEIAATRKAFPDYSERGVITAEGNDVVCEFTMSGTPRDGDRLEFTVNARYSVVDGQIAKVALRFPAAEATRLFQILASSGFEVPDADTLR